MIPFSITMLNLRWWRQWAKDNDRTKPEYHHDYTGSLRALEKVVGKNQAASMVCLGFLFDQHYEIPGVSLVLLDQTQDENLYFGQATVLHWVSLNDEKINSKLRSMGILSWWKA